MNKILAICFLFVIVTLAGCLEETGLKGLPEFTTNGENTIGCIANGQVIYNEYTLSVEALWDEDGDRLSIHATFDDRSQLDLLMYIPDRSLKEFTIDSTNLLKEPFDSLAIASERHVYYAMMNSQCQYLSGAGSDPQSPSTFTIKFRRFDVSGNSGVISGTFEATMKTRDCGDMKITDGRFDIMVGPKPDLDFGFGPS
jgi:hypothetical protein